MSVPTTPPFRADHVGSLLRPPPLLKARDTATTGTTKLTILAPSRVHDRGGPAAIDHGVYPDTDVLWEDLGAAYADELRRLADIGCTYLQLDDTSLAYLNDPVQRAEISRRGED